MNDGSDRGSAPASRRFKFAPKVPVRKAARPASSKSESSAGKDDVIDRELLAKINSAKSQDSFARRFKGEKKTPPAQVTFGYDGTPREARSFGIPQGSIESSSKEDEPSHESPSKPYIEPWDYARSNYPITLPLRRPYSGDPEVLDKFEFGEGGTQKLPINESQINAAEQLGLMEESDEPKMIFLQFPTRLPVVVPPPDEGRDHRRKATSSSPAGKLEDLPPGYMGKLLVYKSGKVKMKLGEILFDVSPGVGHIFSEEVVAINAKERQFCVLGELNKHAVVTPDVDSLLDSLDDSAG
ncbi:hypothetical protein HPP92_019067 [Vanilla planifolia]|uniref:DNA-directed RNA polymerase III subunit RPC4 n=1 Tax=Vanilla planifolia TaxID=51239 RepID=A0A835QGU5_VANPL|nr:hypothetical protein HPP92_019067 [Vanilla planifolia]